MSIVYILASQEGMANNQRCREESSLLIAVVADIQSPTPGSPHIDGRRNQLEGHSTRVALAASHAAKQSQRHNTFHLHKAIRRNLGISISYLPATAEAINVLKKCLAKPR